MDFLKAKKRVDRITTKCVTDWFLSLSHACVRSKNDGFMCGGRTRHSISTKSRTTDNRISQ